jgi:hypothetical protein
MTPLHRLLRPISPQKPVTPPIPCARLVTTTLDDQGQVILRDDGKPLLLMTRKQALGLIERLAVALAGGKAGA